MLQRDYLMRYIEAFGKALAEILLRKKSRAFDEALRVINSTLEDDADTKAVHELPLDTFIEYIDFMEDFDPKKWVMVAELLYERADILRLMERTEASYEAYVKSLHLMLECLNSDRETYREKEEKRIWEIVKALTDVGIPAATMALLNEFNSGNN